MMKERPILFSGPMVRALLNGSKTQTRREFKVRGWQAVVLRALEFVRVLHGSATSVLSCAQPADTAWAGFKLSADSTSPMYFKCPYGQPGDRLWVRESYRLPNGFDIDSPARVAERCLDAGYSKPWAPIQYDADGSRRDWKHVDTPPHVGGPDPGKGRPSIHMPRWASRILLEITGVRVERLQAISEADARAEGITDGGCMNCGGHEPCVCPNPSPDARDAYAGLWEDINGAGSWGANPWVWVVEFKRVDFPRHRI